VLLEEQFIYEPEQRRLQVLKGIILKRISEVTLLAIERTHLIRSEPYQDSFTYELSHDTLVEPILKSYRIRKAAEEQKENERRREAELVAVRARSRRQRNLIVVVSVAAIFSAGFAIFGFSMWNTSEKALQEVETARRKAESAVLNYEMAEKKRKEAEVSTCLGDARSFEMYGKMEDARRSVEKALQIDPANKQALELMNKYKPGK
jgi:flagellar basal body-associated protein FliL